MQLTVEHMLSMGEDLGSVPRIKKKKKKKKRYIQ